MIHIIMQQRWKKFYGRYDYNILAYNAINQQKLHEIKLYKN